MKFEDQLCKAIAITSHLEERVFSFKGFACVDNRGKVDVVNNGEFFTFGATQTHSRGTIRGLHRQNIDKLYYCLSGAIWDVWSDGITWNGKLLEKGNGISLPKESHLYHGFQTLEDDTLLLWICTGKSEEEGIRWDDPKLKIYWPFPLSEISEKDKGWPLL